MPEIDCAHTRIYEYLELQHTFKSLITFTYLVHLSNPTISMHEYTGTYRNIYLLHRDEKFDL